MTKSLNLVTLLEGHGAYEGGQQPEQAASPNAEASQTEADQSKV